MDLTIKDDEYRFGVRTAAIIFNNDSSKILVQKVKDIYMFPGGRMHIYEDSYNAIKRELIEELNIDEDIKLKYTAESFIKLPNGKKYHEVGYFYLLKIDETKYNLDNNDKILTKDINDGNIYFEWIDISKIDSYNVVPKKIFDRIKKLDIIDDNKIEHIINYENE